MSEKNLGGRPKKPDEKLMNVIVPVKMRTSTFEMFTAQADRVGMGNSTLARKIIMEWLEEINFENQAKSA